MSDGPKYPTHSAWCLRLKTLGILEESHRRCIDAVRCCAADPSDAVLATSEEFEAVGTTP